MDDTPAQRIVSEVAAQSSQILALAQHERDRRKAAGLDTSCLDEFLTEFTPAAEQIGDLEAAMAIRAVVQRHGTGPYPPEDLAAFIERDLDTVRRALTNLEDAGIAERMDQE